MQQRLTKDAKESKASASDLEQQNKILQRGKNEAEHRWTKAWSELLQVQTVKSGLEQEIQKLEKEKGQLTNEVLTAQRAEKEAVNDKEEWERAFDNCALKIQELRGFLDAQVMANAKLIKDHESLQKEHATINQDKQELRRRCGDLQNHITVLLSKVQS